VLQAAGRDQAPPASLACGRFRLGLNRPLVMGILNVTPDSFSDGGRYVDPGAAIAQAERLVEDGADWIDVGAESTRPGSLPITAEVELERLLPVLGALVGLGVPISVDTRRAEVMQAALALGVDCINDVEALRSSEALRVVQSSNCAVCLMHMQASPGTMQLASTYDDVVLEVGQFLRDRVAVARAHGIAAERIVVDPGIGFGKTTQQNLALIAHAAELVPGYPVLIGLSRKRVVGEVTGRALDERLAGSLGGALAAVVAGAAVVRVHDVAATVDALAVWQAVRDAGDDAQEWPTRNARGFG